MQAFKSEAFLKKNSNTGVFKNTQSEKYLRMADSGYLKEFNDKAKWIIVTAPAQKIIEKKLKQNVGLYYLFLCPFLLSL